MQEKYKADLKEIKEIMNRSSRFISLSGLSGISVGIIALIGAYLAYNFVYLELGELDYERVHLSNDTLTQLVLITTGTLVLSIIMAIVFTKGESKKKNQGIWDLQSKRLVINLSIPLVTGGILCLILLLKGFIVLLAPFTLIFHGLALVNASQYTLKEIRSLGLLMIFLGLTALFYIDLGLLFWAIGFGGCHILYGVMMQLKNKS